MVLGIVAKLPASPRSAPHNDFLLVQNLYNTKLASRAASPSRSSFAHGTKPQVTSESYLVDHVRLLRTRERGAANAREYTRDSKPNMGADSFLTAHARSAPSSGPSSSPAMRAVSPQSQSNFGADSFLLAHARSVPRLSNGGRREAHGVPDSSGAAALRIRSSATPTQVSPPQQRERREQAAHPPALASRERSQQQQPPPPPQQQRPNHHQQQQWTPPQRPPIAAVPRSATPAQRGDGGGYRTIDAPATAPKQMPGAASLMSPITRPALESLRLKERPKQAAASVTELTPRSRSMLQRHRNGFTSEAEVWQHIDTLEVRGRDRDAAALTALLLSHHHAQRQPWSAAMATQAPRQPVPQPSASPPPPTTHVAPAAKGATAATPPLTLHIDPPASVSVTAHSATPGSARSIHQQPQQQSPRAPQEQPVAQQPLLPTGAAVGATAGVGAAAALLPPQPSATLQDAKLQTPTAPVPSPTGTPPMGSAQVGTRAADSPERRRYSSPGFSSATNIDLQAHLPSGTYSGSAVVRAVTH